MPNRQYCQTERISVKFQFPSTNYIRNFTTIKHLHALCPYNWRQIFSWNNYYCKIQRLYLQQRRKKTLIFCKIWIRLCCLLFSDSSCSPVFCAGKNPLHQFSCSKSATSWHGKKSVVSVVSCRFPNSITTTCWQQVGNKWRGNVCNGFWLNGAEAHNGTCNVGHAYTGCRLSRVDSQK